MLLQAIKKQVETRLESSLHNRVYIIPDKDKNPSQVEHPWNIDVKSGSKHKFRLPKNTSIINVFDQAGVEGRLLILGKPGAGKTTMLLELAKVLVQRAEEDLNEPVPVLLSLSSWQNDHQSITDWIVAELSSRKYYRVRKDITKQWLEYGEIIPLLDGLDELAAERQEKCVEKLNDFLQPGNWINPLVVCSRIEEYQIYSTQLALNTSVELQPFNDKQIQDYLQHTGNAKLWNSIKNNTELSELAQTPFFLNVIVLSSQKLSLDKWHEFKSSEERLNYLFSTYVEVMLERRYQGKRPSDKKTKRWLGWLAYKLIEQDETEFFLEKIQPVWLQSIKQKRIYWLMVRLFGGLNIGIVSGFFFVLIGKPIIGLFLGTSIGLSCIELIFPLSHYATKNNLYSRLISRLIGRFVLVDLSENKIKTFEQLQFNWHKLLILWLSAGLIIGSIVGLTGELYFALYCGLIVGLFFGLSGGLMNSEIETKINPNQGIWKSLQNAVVIGLSVGLISGLIAVLSFKLLLPQSEGLIGEIFRERSADEGWLLIGALNVGLPFGALFGLVAGGLACIQHLSLRLILYHNGYIPWNYARFLDYATDRLFLQRVGGGYRFIHDFLRQHFATNYR